MIREELIFVATCDISGLARGKGFEFVDAVSSCPSINTRPEPVTTM